MIRFGYYYDCILLGEYVCSFCSDVTNLCACISVFSLRRSRRVVFIEINAFFSLKKSEKRVSFPFQNNDDKIKWSRNLCADSQRETTLKCALLLAYGSWNNNECQSFTISKRNRIWLHNKIIINGKSKRFLRIPYTESDLHFLEQRTHVPYLIFTHQSVPT